MVTPFKLFTCQAALPMLGVRGNGEDDVLLVDFSAICEVSVVIEDTNLDTLEYFGEAIALFFS